jgi:hypothetical protein
MSQPRSTARVNTMQKFRWFLAALGVLGALALAGCNGPGDSSFAGTSSSSSSSGTVAPPIASITLLESSPNLPSDNSKPVTLTAIARNASNQLVPGAAIDFIATSGGILPVQTTAGSAGTNTVVAGTTDANGEAQAQLTTPGDYANRAITVTATSGGATANIVVNVVGTTLTVTGAANLISGAAATYTVALVDAGSNGIAGQTVTIASAAKNTLSSTSVVTDALGHASFQVTASVAGNDTITVSWMGLNASQALSVSAQSFTFAAPATLSPPLNSPQTLTVNWTNAGAPQSGTVTFATTRGLFPGNVVSVTEPINNGTASIQLSSSTAGPALVTATAVTGTTTVIAQQSLNFVATVPAAIDLQASPATISVQGQSTITAIVRDASNNLVSGQTVVFQLQDVTNGSISVGSVVTNQQGQAQTVYKASTTASATNGVQITASIPSAPAVPPTTVDLTVGGQALFLSLGTGSIVGENTQKTQFQLPYVVQAVDAGGNPVANVSLTMKVQDLPPADPVAGSPYAWNASAPVYAAYAKGVYVKQNGLWVQNIDAYCLNEDLAGTGVFETAEDLNGNGVLDPGGVVTVSPSPAVTDSTGTANVTLFYPEDHALWVQVKLTATATVAGTQTSTSAVFWLPILATYLTNTSQTPPGLFSPYGYGAGLSYRAGQAGLADLSAAQLLALEQGTPESASCSDPQ